jgi:hypothetical protein
MYMIFMRETYVISPLHLGIAMDNCLSWNCYVEIGRNQFKYPAGRDICQEAGGRLPYPTTNARVNDLIGKFGILWVGLTADSHG